MGDSQLADELLGSGLDDGGCSPKPWSFLRLCCPTLAATCQSLADTAKSIKAGGGCRVPEQSEFAVESAMVGKQEPRICTAVDSFFGLRSQLIQRGELLAECMIDDFFHLV